MSGHNDRYVVGIDMVELEMGEDPDPDDHPTEENNAADLRSPYKAKFKSILTEGYNDQMTWWVAVEDLLKRDHNFAEKVRCSSAFLQARRILQASFKLLLSTHTHAGRSEGAGGGGGLEEAGHRRSDGGPPT